MAEAKSTRVGGTSNVERPTLNIEGGRMTNEEFPNDEVTDPRSLLRQKTRSETRRGRTGAGRSQPRVSASASTPSTLPSQLLLLTPDP